MAATTTVTNIMGLVKEDLQELFVASGTTSVLIEYCDRIHKKILGYRDWPWLLSAPKKFITELGRTDYWIGATGSQAAGQVDTALNLTDVDAVRIGKVYSRSGFRELYPTQEPPLGINWQNEDGSYRQDRPAVFRNDDLSPNVLSIYPAPDEGSTYEIVPPPPILTTGAGGALAARTYFVKISFVDEQGNEGAASSPAARQFIGASNLITVKAPVAPISAGTSGVRYNQYNVYAGTVEGSETKQNASPTSTSSDWTEAASGLTTTGAAVPTSSDIEPLRGYIIEFRYWKARTTLTTGADILLVPDEFRHVVAAGVNWLGCKYLRQWEAAAHARADFGEGLKDMSGDLKRGFEFIAPPSQHRESF